MKNRLFRVNNLSGFTSSIIKRNWIKNHFRDYFVGWYSIENEELLIYSADIGVHGYFNEDYFYIALNKLNSHDQELIQDQLDRMFIGRIIK